MITFPDAHGEKLATEELHLLQGYQILEGVKKYQGVNCVGGYPHEWDQRSPCNVEKKLYKFVEKYHSQKLSACRVSERFMTIMMTIFMVLRNQVWNRFLLINF